MAKSRKLALLYLIALCEIFVLFCQTNIVGLSTVYPAIFECVCLIIYLLVFFYNKKFKKSVLLFLGGFVVCLLVSFLTHRTGVEYMSNLLILLLAFLVVKCDDTDKINFTFRFKLACLFPLLIIIVICLLKTPKGDPNLVLKPGEINPNGFGFILFVLSTVALSYYANSKNKFYLLVSFALCAFQIIYSARISILSNLLVYFLYLLSRNNKNGNLKLLYGIFIFFMLIQILFPYVYADVLFKLIGKGKIIILGKDIFTGRQIIWTEWFKQMQGNYLFGIGNNFVSSWVMDGVTDGRISIHNSSLAIVSNFGIITYIFYFLFLSRLFKPKKTLPLNDNRNNRDAMNLIYLSAVMLNGLTDTVLISAFNVGVIILGLLLINLFKFNKREGSV